MTSTARIRLNRFITIDAVEWQDIARQNRPRTVADAELDLLRAHGSAASNERQIRECWAIRRAVQKRSGMGRLDGGAKSERQVFLLRSAIDCLRSYRETIRELNAEVEAIEVGRIDCAREMAADQRDGR